MIESKDTYEKKAQDFYKKIIKFCELQQNCPEHLQIIALLRTALEVAGKGEMGLLKVCYLFGKVQNTTLGMMNGTDDSFENLLEEFDPSNFNNTKH